MNRDQIKGAAEKAKGTIEDTAGKITADAKLQAEGKLEKAKGAQQPAATGAAAQTATKPKEVLDFEKKAGKKKVKVQTGSVY